MRCANKTFAAFLTELYDAKSRLCWSVADEYDILLHHPLTCSGITSLLHADDWDHFTSAGETLVTLRAETHYQLLLLITSMCWPAGERGSAAYCDGDRWGVADRWGAAVCTACVCVCRLMSPPHLQFVLIINFAEGTFLRPSHYSLALLMWLDVSVYSSLHVVITLLSVWADCDVTWKIRYDNYKTF